MKTIRVTVESEDIGKGRRNSTYSCPIALALRRKFDVAMLDVFVSHSTAHVGLRKFRMSAAAGEFVHRFDLGKPVKPVSFVLKEQS